MIKLSTICLIVLNKSKKVRVKMLTNVVWWGIMDLWIMYVGKCGELSWYVF